MRYGQIDYTSCFRNSLHDLVTERPKVKVDDDNGSVVSKMPRDIGPSHPWEFDYRRDMLSDGPTPYWMTACKESKFGKSSSSNANNNNSSDNILSGNNNNLNNNKSVADINSTILSNYDAKVVSICAKCIRVYNPIWRSLRIELKRGQLTSRRGCIVKTNFIAILDHYGVNLSRSEIGAIIRAFRVPGLQDVLNFEEFMKICYYAGQVVEGNSDADMRDD